MLTPKDREILLEKLRLLPELLGAIVQGLDDAQLDTPYGEGKWTIRQVVHHLADSHANGYARTRMTITETNPTLKSYDQDAWAGLPDAKLMPLRPSLLILTGLHDRWATMLAGLKEADWKRTAQHPEDGPRTLDDLLVDYAGHGEKHVGHISSLLEKKGW